MPAPPEPAVSIDSAEEMTGDIDSQEVDFKVNGKLSTPVHDPLAKGDLVGVQLTAGK